MSRAQLSAAVSTALYPIWTGQQVEATVVAVFERAIYLDLGAGEPRLVTVVTFDGVHQPGAIVVHVTAAAQPFRELSIGQTVHVGGQQLALGAQTVRATRWWNPRPQLASRTPAQLRALAAAIDNTAARHPAWTHMQAPQLLHAAQDVARALVDHTVDEAVHHALRLIGAGPGLTPAGDDMLAGLIAGLQLFGPAAGKTHDGGRSASPARAGLAAAAAIFGERVAKTASDRTTFISAALLAHAARAEVARPVAIMLADPRAATVTELLRIGATSGADMCHGIVLAARAHASVDRPNDLSDTRHAALAERPN